MFYNNLQTPKCLLRFLYESTSSVASVDEARMELLPRKEEYYDALPPLRASLRDHAKLAAYCGRIICFLATTLPIGG